MRQEYSAGKLSLKLLAAFLTCTMFFSSLPTEVIARELDTLRLAQSAASEDITEKSEPAIVGEIIDRRGDARKEFILDNGVRMAVVYPMAVHYRDGDSWQEIDNTLTLDSKDNTYHNTAGVWDISLPSVLDTENTVTLTRGTNVLRFSFNGALDGEAEPVFYLPAPYMYDSRDAFCGDIGVSLEKTSSGYFLTYTLPTEWMSDAAREYPIVLDPVVQADSSALTIEDQTVSEYEGLDYRWGKLQMGYLLTSNNGTGKERAFIKFNNLPDLTSADVIVEARLSLKKSDSTRTGILEVHQVTGGTWSSQTITWNNMPAVKAEVEDYQNLSTGGYYHWNVTCSAQYWYASGTNTGLMLRMPDSVENGGTEKFLQVYSSDFGPWDLPILKLFYINNCGLEDTWDYLTQSAGRAGTGYVNSYTGNLVWVHKGLGFAGNRMPVSINAIYNANDKSNNSFGLGYGWRTNYNQIVYQWSVDGNYYCVWEDGDGTRHYFLYDSSAGKYIDELNSKRTITANGSGNTKYHLADEENYTDTLCTM